MPFRGTVVPAAKPIVEGPFSAIRGSAEATNVTYSRAMFISYRVFSVQSVRDTYVFRTSGLYPEVSARFSSWGRIYAWLIYHVKMESDTLTPGLCPLLFITRRTASEE